MDIDFFTRISRCFDENELNDIIMKIENFLNSQLKISKNFRIWKSYGDEFLIVVLGCSKITLNKQLNKLKSLFRQQRFAQGSGRDYSNIMMSFSAGVASFPEDGADLLTVIRKSVTGMFLAKAYRRNRIVNAPEENKPACERVIYNMKLRIDIILGSYGETGSVTEPVTATTARFSEPQAIDTDRFGRIYIADQNNDSVTMYDGQTVRKVAGGLSRPTGLAVYGDSLYITDTGNDTVRLVDLQSGEVSNFAGDFVPGYSGDGEQASRARLNKPGGAVIDMEGNVYVNDIANNVIRKINRENVITTFAGTGWYGHTGDGGQASQASFAEIYGLGIDRLRGFIYTADYFNHCIRKIDIAKGIVTTVAGCGEEGYSGDGGNALNARLSRPVAVCSDEHGNLFIAESGNHCVRFYHAREKLIYTLVGDGAAGIGESGAVSGFRLANPNGLAVYGNNLYILDGANNRLCQIKLDGDMNIAVCGHS